MMMWREVIEEHGTYFCWLVFFAIVFLLVAYFSGDWTKLPAELSYIFSPIAILLWPLFVMDRHRRK